MSWDILARIVTATRIPEGFIEGAWGLFGIGVALFSFSKNLRQFVNRCCLLILIEYSFLFFCSTVVFRYKDNFGWHLMPMWSYWSAYHGKLDLLYDNLLNVLLFIPIGLFLWPLLSNNRIRKLISYSIVLSMTVEITQYIFNKGVAETDDIIHNTLGCLLGYLLMSILSQFVSFIGRIFVKK